MIGRVSWWALLLCVCAPVAVTPICGPDTCAGCCDADGSCQGPSLEHCANRGRGCVDCAAICGDAGCVCGAASTCELASLPEPRDAGLGFERVPRFVDSIGWSANQLGVIVNLDDPASVLVAEYYVRVRGVPKQNVVELHLTANKVLDPAVFAPQRRQLVDALAGRDVRALALTGLWPFRVGCMSVTSAFALGFDLKWCSTPCSLSAVAPPLDAGVWPTMLIAGRTVGDALALIERGRAADHSFPLGDAFLVRTSDALRSVRWPDFSATADAWAGSPALDVRFVDTDAVKNEPRVLFYLTGLSQVSGLASNHYLPGAFADHLTSYGGQVPDSVQMSALRWLEAGATASYGTVIEPCNFAEKFPAASVLLEHSFRGETLLEAAWRSVQMPGEGLFIGEPLAAPFGRRGEHYEASSNSLSFETTELTPGHSYLVEQAPTEQGPWLPAMTLPIAANYRSTVIRVDVDAGFYRLTEQH